MNAPPHPSADWMRSAGETVLHAMPDDFLRLGEHGIGRTATRGEMEKLLREPAPVARRVCLSRKRHACRQHPFEPADAIAKISNLLAHACQINRSGAYTLVEEDDLAQRPDRVAVEAHAAAVFPRRLLTGSRLDGPVKVSATLR